MTLYSVYARQDRAPAAVADRFSWFAALLPPVYALVHGLWLMLLGWVVGVLALWALGLYAGGDAAFWTYILLAVLTGLEAPTLRRTWLSRHGWRYRGEIVAPDEDLAIVETLKRT